MLGLLGHTHPALGLQLGAAGGAGLQLSEWVWLWRVRGPGAGEHPWELAFLCPAGCRRGARSPSHRNAPTLRSWGALQSQRPTTFTAPPSPPTCANGPSNRKRKDLSRHGRPWLPLASVSVPGLSGT